MFDLDMLDEDEDIIAKVSQHQSIYNLGEMMLLASQFLDYKDLLKPGQEILMTYLGGSQYTDKDFSLMELLLKNNGVVSMRKERAPDDDMHGDFFHVWAYRPALDERKIRLETLFKNKAASEKEKGG